MAVLKLADEVYELQGWEPPAKKSRAGGSKKASIAARPNVPKVNPALMTPVQPSKELAAIVGHKPLPRSEVIAKVWDYIKKHKLQDPGNKRKIVSDTKLHSVTGKSHVSLFELSKQISDHLK